MSSDSTTRVLKTSDGDPVNNSLRIAVVAHALRTAGGLSVGRNLIEAMVDVAPKNTYSFIVPNGVGYEELCGRTPNAQVHPTGPMGAFERLRFDRYKVPAVLESFVPEVVLALDSSHALRDPRWPQAVFVHASHLVYPTRHYGPRSSRDKVRHAYLKWHFRRSLARTSLVFVQTEVMASRLRSAFGFSGKVSVVGTSVSSSLLDSSPTTQEPPIDLLPYSDHFKLLCVAQYYPHKGIERIVDVFDQFRDELANVVVFLTITPDQHPNSARILKRIERLGLADQIVNLSKLSHEEIGPYYWHCDAMLMPTTLECFSTTYVEAMACDLPILTSDLDFAHVSCGDAALYFDPWKPGSIKDAILRLYRNPDLRDHLADEGRSRAQIMRTWNEIAVGVIDDLRGIADADQTGQRRKR